MSSGGATGRPADEVREGDAVQFTGETVRTSRDLIEDTTSILAPDVVTLERAGRVLAEMFGPLVDADYIPGKTLFCDAIAGRFGVSIGTAEELCDELERAARIRFVRTEDGAGWHIHGEADAP